MTTTDTTLAPTEFSEVLLNGRSPAAAPELGDVVDSLEDAVVTFKSIVTNEANSLLGEFRALIRDRPIASLAIASGLAYLIGRLGR